MWMVSGSGRLTGRRGYRFFLKGFVIWVCAGQGSDAPFSLGASGLPARFGCRWSCYGRWPVWFLRAAHRRPTGSRRLDGVRGRERVPSRVGGVTRAADLGVPVGAPVLAVAAWLDSRLARDAGMASAIGLDSLATSPFCACRLPRAGRGLGGGAAAIMAEQAIVGVAGLRGRVGSFKQGGEKLQLEVPDQVMLELEVEIKDGGTELEPAERFRSRVPAGSGRRWTPAGSMNVARCRYLAAPLPPARCRSRYR